MLARNAVILGLASVLVGVAAGRPVPKLPPPILFGVSLDMPKAEVDRMLGKRGELTDERVGRMGAKQTWRLDDHRYEWLQLRYGPELRVAWATLMRRSDGPPVRFTEIGDPAAAALTGSYAYTWAVPAEEEQPGYLVIARGNDAEHLFSLSLAPAAR